MADFQAADLILRDRSQFQKTPSGGYILRDVSGVLLGEISWEYLLELIEAGLVTGRGTKSKIRFFQMVYDQQQTEERLRSSLKAGRSQRPRRPLDLLVRMCADRKFTARERINVGLLRRCLACLQATYRHFCCGSQTELISTDGKIRAVFLHNHKPVYTRDE